MRRGELAEAEESIGSAAEEMVAWGQPPQLLAYPAALLAEIQVERGDLAAARASADVVEVPPTADVSRLLLGARLGLMLAEGRDEEVVALAERYRQYFPRIVNPAWAPWRPPAAEALARLGRAGEALELIRADLEQARIWGAPGAIGRALRVQGVIEREAGIPALEESVRVLDGSPARLELAKSLVALGTALRLARRPTDAREPLARGLSLAAACGAPPLAERARAELQAAGVRARSDALSGVGALTASERRVADLATEGHTNKDIAQLLYVTPKTIEVHLSSVYRSSASARVATSPGPCSPPDARSAAGDRADHAQRLLPRGDRRGQRRVGRLVGEVAPAGHVAHVRPAAAGAAVADRAEQGGVVALEAVQDRVDRAVAVDLHRHLRPDAGERAEVVRERHPDPGSRDGLGLDRQHRGQVLRDGGPGVAAVRRAVHLPARRPEVDPAPVEGVHGHRVAEDVDVAVALRQAAPEELPLAAAGPAARHAQAPLRAGSARRRSGSGPRRRSPARGRGRRPGSRSRSAGRRSPRSKSPRRRRCGRRPSASA